MATNETKDDGRRQLFELYYPSGREGKALLSTWLVDDCKTVELDPRLARLLQVLIDARTEDARGQFLGALGWRSRDQIARQIAQRSRGYRPDKTTVSSYACELLAELGRAFGDQIPALIERRRYLGYRIGEHVDIVVVDGTPPDDEADGKPGPPGSAG